MEICFDQFKGSISVDELEDPLIALGLAESRDQVQKIIDSVDADKSGQIEFDEFLTIVKTNSNTVPSILSIFTLTRMTNVKQQYIHSLRT